MIIVIIENYYQYIKFSLFVKGFIFKKTLTVANDNCYHLIATDIENDYDYQLNEGGEPTYASITTLT